MATGLQTVFDRKPILATLTLFVSITLIGLEYFILFDVSGVPTSVQTVNLTDHGTAVPITSKCDPYSTPAGLIEEHTGVWVPFQNASGCRTMGVDELQGLKDAVRQMNGLPRHLANRSVLLYGDSFERFLVLHLCELSNQPVQIALLNGSLMDSGNGGDSRICVFKSGYDTFLAINIFHYGVMGSFNHRPTGSHWYVQLPRKSAERIAWIPHFLRSVVGAVAPNLCPEKTFCQPGPKIDMSKTKDRNLNIDLWYSENMNQTKFWFPLPSLVVAQSSMWDFARVKEDGGSLATATFQGFLREWKIKAYEEVFAPLLELFHDAERSQQPADLPGGKERSSTQFYTRTLPEMARKSDYASNDRQRPVTDINAEIRKCAFCYNSNKTRPEESIIDVTGNHVSLSYQTEDPQGFGVLDWAALVSNSDIEIHQDDGEHPSKLSSLAFWQLILSRFENTSL